MKHGDVTAAIIGCAFDIHNELGPGFLEAVYEAALELALREAGHQVLRQTAIDVRFRGQVIGEYRADLIID